MIQRRAIAAKSVTCIQRCHNSVCLDHFQSGYTGDKFGDVVISRMHHDLLGRTGLNNASVAHNGNAIAYTHRFIQIVSDEDGGLFHLCGQVHKLILQLSSD